MKILRMLRHKMYTLYNAIVVLISRKSIYFNGYHKISLHAHLRRSDAGKIKIGENAVIREFTLVDAVGGRVSLGKNVFINRNTMIVSKDRITIGDDVSIGPNVCIYDHDHDIHNRGNFVSDPVIIGNNVWIGAGVIILRGTVIGDDAVIGAGTVIKKDIVSGMKVFNSQNLSVQKIQF